MILKMLQINNSKESQTIQRQDSLIKQKFNLRHENWIQEKKEHTS